MRVTIDELDAEGRGVGPSEDGRLRVHVAGALPGEKVRAHVEHRSPHAAVAWASLVALDGAPSPDRVAPVCPGAGRCGGCSLQHLRYGAQLAYKRARLARALARAGVAPAPVAEVVASPRTTGYRNKAKYVLADAHGALAYGSWGPGTHHFVDMAGCRVPEEPIDAVAAAAVRALRESGLQPYDERARTGELRYLVVRAGAGGRVLVVVVARSAAGRDALAAAARRLGAARPEVAGVLLNVNDTEGGAILGTEEHVLCGATELADQVGEVPLRLGARTFFQVNRAQASALYAAVVHAAMPPAGARVAGAAGAEPVRALDLYCGAGAIALSLARAGARVAGVERAGPAVEDARRSARAAGLAERTTFVEGDAAGGLAETARAMGGVDVVVVNPPRQGLGADVREALAVAAPPRLVYVSCGPESLAADLAVLAGRGYALLPPLQPFDLLPGTPHVEAVATLVRRGAATPGAGGR